jgi:hypothetical protein
LLVILSLRNEEAEPLEVAIIATIPDATASFTGIPKRTKIGIRILAPPRPVRDPRNPTKMQIKSSDIMSIKRADLKN